MLISDYSSSADAQACKHTELYRTAQDRIELPAGGRCSEFAKNIVLGKPRLRTGEHRSDEQSSSEMQLAASI